MKTRFPYWAQVTAGIAIFGYIYVRSAHGALGWPLAVVLGICFGFLVILFTRRRSMTLPFRLVLRLANDKTGDSEDDKLFEKLHARFKSQAADKGLKFGGFDIGSRYMVFYFNGRNPSEVRDAVLSLVSDCKFREGSYFETSETEREPLAVN